MSIAQLARIQKSASEGVRDLLLASAELVAVVGEHGIYATEDSRILPMHVDFPCVAYKADLNTDFTAIDGGRQTDAEIPLMIQEVYVYDLVRSLKPGATLIGEGQQQGLLEIRALVFEALYNQTIDGFYWFMPISIISAEPFPVLGEEEEEEDLACLTIMSWELRKFVKTNS